MNIYKTFARPILSRIDPERAHHLALKAGQLFRAPALKRMLSKYCGVSDARLAQELFGLKFPNPIGLAAGVDKNGEALDFFAAVGFGHVEVGTVTSSPQPGNPKPRMFRLREDQALINRLGFPSQGAEVVGARLEKYSKVARSWILGVNIGKLKAVEIEQAASDYVRTFLTLRSCADYFVINVSSPNTPELRKLQEKERLKDLLMAVQAANTNKIPLLIKISPDLSFEQLNDVLTAGLQSNIAGIIATNTTLAREGLRSNINEIGGLSGKPLKEKARNFVSHIYRETSGKLPIIGVGGIFGTDDVISFMCAGASLIQCYTALVYEGPFLVSRIQNELQRYLEREGLAHISDIIGKG